MKGALVDWKDRAVRRLVVEGNTQRIQSQHLEREQAWSMGWCAYFGESPEKEKGGSKKEKRKVD